MMLFRVLTILLVSSFLAGPALATSQPLDTAPRLTLPVVSGGSPADSDYSEAIKRMAAGDATAAEALFKSALEKDPGHANSLLGLAEIAARRNHTDLASKLIYRAVKADPNNAHAQASLGRLLAMQGRYSDAEVALKKAGALDRNLIRPRMDLADLYATALRKPVEAIALYRNVIAIAPNHAGAHYGYGMAQMRQGNPLEARTAFELSARLEPENPLPAIALARVSLQENSLDDAMTWIESALKVQPTFADALELRGDVQQARKSPESALADYAAAVRVQPNQVSALMKQGVLLQQMGRTDDAGKAYLLAVKINPKLPVAYNNLAWMAVENKKNLDQAEAWSKKAVDLGPEMADFHDTLGWVYRAKGNLKAAEQSLKRATSLKYAPASAFYHLGLVLQESGKPKEAADAFEKTLALDNAHRAAEQALRRLSEPK